MVDRGWVTPVRAGQLVVVALVLAPIVFLLVIPSFGDRRLVDVNGPTVLLVLSVPLVLTVVPLAFDSRTGRIVSIVAALLLLVFAFLGSATVGYFFVPAALALVIVAIWPRLWRAEKTRRSRESGDMNASPPHARR